MRTALLSAAAALLVAGTANAVTISVSTFSTSAYDDATSGNFVVENFDTPGDITANGGTTFTSGSDSSTVADSFDTKVGNFSSAGGSGTGGTCGDLNGGTKPCDSQIALTNIEPNGQSGAVSDNYLNSLDTDGIIWDVGLEDDSAFNRIVFGLVDAADIRDVFLVITVDDVTTFATINGPSPTGSEEIPNGSNANEKLVVIDFDQLVTGATVSLINNYSDNPDGRRVNDAFGLDGSAVGVVPLPATGLLLLGGIGAIGMMRRRKKAA